MDCARQALLSFTISWSLLKLMSIELGMLSSHLILCCPPSSPAFNLSQHQHLFQCFGSFTSGGQYWSFSFSISPVTIQGWFPFGLTGLISLQPKGLLRVFSSTTIWKHQFSAFFMVQLSHPYMTTGRTTALAGWTFVSKVMSQLWSCDALW